MNVRYLAIGWLLVLAGCATPRSYDAYGETRQFATQCHDLAHQAALVRFARRESFEGTNAICEEVRPVLHRDREVVHAAERLFVATYQSLPPEEQARVAPGLVTFGTTGTWAVARSEITSAVYAVRSALVDALLGQLLFGITGAVERVPESATPAWMTLYLRGLGWNDERAVDAEWSSDEIPGVLAERLLNDTEVRTVQVVDRIPFLPFITSRGTYTVSICQRIAGELTGPGPLDHRLQAALDQIRTRPDHPAYEFPGNAH